MSIYKKDIPLQLLELIDPYLKKGYKYVKVDTTSSNKLIAKFIDKDPDSKFHFIIEACKVEVSKPKVLVVYMPYSKIELKEQRSWIHIDEFQKIFLKWAGIIEEYSKINFPPKNPILTQYEEEFKMKLNIVDDDSDTYSFNLEQQLLLDEYLADVKRDINNINVVIKGNINTKTEIIQKIEILRTEIGSLSKNETMSMFGKILAIIRIVDFKVFIASLKKLESKIIQKINIVGKLNT